MRFSRTTTFSDPPIADLSPWRAVIQQNVRRDQVATGLSAMFILADPGDGSSWYVEVTLNDYLALFPDPVTMDVEGPVSMDIEEPEPTNSYALDDNCHYVTAAALLGITTAQLFAKIEKMQDRDDMTDPDISELFVLCGLNGAYDEYDSFDEMEEAIAAYGGGHDRRFAVSYGRADGTGHMVVGEYSATTDSTDYLDYQETEAEDAYDDVAAGTEFALYPQ